MDSFYFDPTNLYGHNFAHHSSKLRQQTISRLFDVAAGLQPVCALLEKQLEQTVCEFHAVAELASRLRSSLIFTYPEERSCRYFDEAKRILRSIDGLGWSACRRAPSGPLGIGVVGIERYS